jgi:hypothetical protein
LDGNYQFFFENPVHIVEVSILQNAIPVDPDAVKKVAGFGEIKLKASSSDGEDAGSGPRKKPHFPKPEIEHQVEP